jgi:hypothetical protein
MYVYIISIYCFFIKNYYECVCITGRPELGKVKEMVLFRITEREGKSELKLIHIPWNFRITNSLYIAFQNIIQAKISRRGVTFTPILVLYDHNRCLSVVHSNLCISHSSYEKEFWPHPISTAREITGGCRHIIGSAHVKYDVESVCPVRDMLIVEQPISCKTVNVII